MKSMTKEQSKAIPTKWKLVEENHNERTWLIHQYKFEPIGLPTLFLNLTVCITNKSFIGELLDHYFYKIVVELPLLPESTKKQFESIFGKKFSTLDFYEEHRLEINFKETSTITLIKFLDNLEKIEELDTDFKKQIHETLTDDFRKQLPELLVSKKTQQMYQEEMTKALENNSFTIAFEIAKEAQENKKFEVIWNLAKTIDPKTSEEISNESVPSEKLESNDNVEIKTVEPQLHISTEELINLYKEIVNNPDNPHRKEAAKRLFDLQFAIEPPSQSQTKELQEYRKELIKIALVVAEDPRIKDALNKIAHGYSGFNFDETAFSLSGNLIDDVLHLLDVLRKYPNDTREKTRELETENKELRKQIKTLQEENKKLKEDASILKFSQNPQHSFNAKNKNNNQQIAISTKPSENVTRPRSGSCPN